jgi:CBS domain-containing protein
MKAGDVMTAGAATIRQDASLADAARMMLQHHVSGLPVTNADGALVGMVTERDLLRRFEIGTDRDRPGWVAMWLNPSVLAEEYVRTHGRKIHEIMTTDVVSVGTDTPLDEVAEIMERRGYKRVPVVRGDKIVGIVSRANFLLALSRRLGEVSEAPEDDKVIRQRIVDEIDAQRWSPLSMIDIEVLEGLVRLHGTVNDEVVRKAVVVATENTPGVRSVEDNLRVIPFIPMHV